MRRYVNFKKIKSNWKLNNSLENEKWIRFSHMENLKM